MSYCYGLASVVVRPARPLTSSSQELLGQSEPNMVCSIVRRQEIVNFMTSTQRGGNFGVKRVKFMYFFKNLLYSQALIRQTKQVVMMTKEGCTEIVKFI